MTIMTSSKQHSINKVKSFPQRKSCHLQGGGHLRNVTHSHFFLFKMFCQRPPEWLNFQEWSDQKFMIFLFCLIDCCGQVFLLCLASHNIWGKCQRKRKLFFSGCFVPKTTAGVLAFDWSFKAISFTSVIICVFK